jgi:transposase
MPSSVLAPLELSAAERAQLESWMRRRTSAQALALRARIVLLAAAGRHNTQIARDLGIHRNVAGKWRSRFLEHRLDGLTDEPRPGRPRTITDDKVEEVIVKTLETSPRERRTGRRGRWPARSAWRNRRSCASGRRSGRNRTANRPGSSPRIRSSSTRPGRRRALPQSA